MLPGPCLRPVGAITLDEIVVVVNDDVILKSEFESRKQLMASQMRRDGILSANDLLLDKRVLDILILNKLQLQLAGINSITVDDESVDKMIADIADRNKISVDGFRQLLRQDGFVYEEFREDMREEMLLRRLRQSQVDNLISISEEEIDYYLLTLERQGATGREYHLAHILLPWDEDNSEDEEFLRAQADIIGERLTAGDDFAVLATAFSHAADAERGGDLGWLSLPAVPSLFVNRLPELEPGGVAGPIESSSGLHFVKLIEARLGDQVILDRLRGRHIFIVVQDGNWAQARENVTGIHERLLAGADFPELAQEYSDDLETATDGGELGWLDQSRFPADLYSALQALEINELSEPLRTPNGFHIFQILEKGKHDATVEMQREQARESIYRRKLDTARRQWLDRLRSEAYIEIRLTDEVSPG